MSKVYMMVVVNPINAHRVALPILADSKIEAYRLAELARKVVVPIMERGMVDLDKDRFN